MNFNNVYYHEKIKNIPLENLKTILITEIRQMNFDLGKKISENDPDVDYLVERVLPAIKSYYPEWELAYVDTCFKNGMLDEYDKGQTITAKRLFVWMKCYESTLKTSVFAKREETKEYTEFDLKRFAQLGERFPQIILFRIAHKPDFDGDEWTLENIEKTQEFKVWKNRREKTAVNTDSNFKKIR